MSENLVAILKSSGDGDSLYDEAVRKAGFVPLFEPMLKIEYIRMELPEIKEDTLLIFTSAHGVESFVRCHAARTNPVCTVGDDTAQAAKLARFENIVSAKGDGHALSELLIQRHAQTPLISPIYVRATEISYDLASNLYEKGIFLQEIVGYQAHNVQNLSIKMLQALDKGKIKAVLLFSARGAQCFADLIEQYGRQNRLKAVQALCIAPSVLKSVSVLPFKDIQIAKSPDRHGMMELIENISIA